MYRIICFLAASFLLYAPITHVSSQTFDKVVPGAIVLRSLTCVDSVNWFVVDAKGKTFRSLDGGNLWNELTSVSGKNASHVRAFGNLLLLGTVDGEVLASTNKGLSWSVSNLPLNTSVTGVAYRGGKVIAVSSNSGLAYTDSLGEWRWSNIFTTKNRLRISDVTWANDTVAVASTENGVVLRTVDRGENWTEVYDSTTNRLNKVAFIDSVNGLIVGDSSILLVTTTAGATWFRFTLPVNESIRSIAFHSSTNWSLLTTNSKLYRSVDGGFSWNQVTVPGLSSTIAVSLDVAGQSKAVIASQRGRVFSVSY